VLRWFPSLLFCISGRRTLEGVLAQQATGRCRSRRGGGERADTHEVECICLLHLYYVVLMLPSAVWSSVSKLPGTYYVQLSMYLCNQRMHGTGLFVSATSRSAIGAELLYASLKGRGYHHFL
jgi:hypothetical protein